MCPCWLARSLFSIINAFTFSSLHCSCPIQVFKHLNSVTPKKYCGINYFLNNISATKLKMKQTYDLSEKVVVMELEQLSMNDVQKSIEERPNKIFDTIK